MGVGRGQDESLDGQTGRGVAKRAESRPDESGQVGMAREQRGGGGGAGSAVRDGRRRETKRGTEGGVNMGRKMRGEKIWHLGVKYRSRMNRQCAVCAIYKGERFVKNAE